MAGRPLPAPLLVEVVPAGRAGDRLESKLEAFFQSTKRSGGGECEVQVVDRDRGVYRVQFLSEEAKKRIQASECYSIPSTGQTLRIRIRQDSEVMDSARNSLTSSSTSQATIPVSISSTLPSQNSFEKKQLSEKCTDYPPASMTKKIFLSVSASLNTDLFTKEERDQAMARLPTLKIEKSSELGVEKVTGEYGDIEELHQYLTMLLARSRHFGESAHPRRQHNLENIAENGQKKGDENAVEVSNMEVPSAIFEYFSHVCKEEVKELEQRYSVKLTSTEDGSGVTLVRFASAGNLSCVEEAQQRFVTTFQKVAADVKQETIPVTSIPQLTKASEMLNAKFKSILVKPDGSTLILRGPAKELSAAKDLLQEMEKEKIPEVCACVRKTGIPLDANLFEFLEPHLAIEIQSINLRYETVMEKKKGLSGRTTCIIFKPTAKKKSPDRSSQAYENFIRAYQEVLAKPIVKAIPLKQSLDLVKKVNEFFVHLQKENPQVKLIKEKDKLIIHGLPIHVYSAEKHIQQFLFAGLPVSPTDKLSSIHTPKAGTSSGASLEYTGDRKGHSFPSGEPSSLKAAKTEPEEEKCSICMDKIGQKEVLPKCKHAFCKGCIQEAMKYRPVCPVCNEFYGKMEGNQPPGKMDISKERQSLPGYEGFGTITITYSIPDGIQTENHPKPGRRFSGVYRSAYLPDNPEGREILQLLRRAFDQKLIFTVGQSRTTGMDNVVTWNDIHHKTTKYGGVNGFGYPDPNYLKRVREELKAKGIA